MRLIDAERLTDGSGVFSQCVQMDFNIGPYILVDDLIKVLDESPTAYDVEKVVESINEIGQRYCNSVKCDKNCDDCEHGCLMRAITNAVKYGGVTND